MTDKTVESLVYIPSGSVSLEGALAIPAGAIGMVLFAHGSGSSRHSSRNKFVAASLQRNGLATLLTDLLTRAEDSNYQTRFDIGLLTSRLGVATKWLGRQPETRNLAVGYFGASTGAAAALQAAVNLGPAVGAVVSRGGRPDLAMEVLDRVLAPTLLIVGGDDNVVLEFNRQAYDWLRAEKKLTIVPGATHLFEEPGALEVVAYLASDWFSKHLCPKQV